MNIRFIRSLAVLLSAVLFVAPTKICADIGVGVGVGKIEITQKLNPGGIYSLPSVPVINTGTEIAEYELAIEYHEKQAQLKPAPGWFSFNPSRFKLLPGQSKTAQINLAVPIKSVPGDYFAYIKAFPVDKGGSGSTKIGIAAAAKLYFAVAPANILQGVYFRIAGFVARYWVWIVGIFAAIALAISMIIFKRYFKIKIGIRFRKKRKKRTPKTNNEN